jgi:hypothetical protein
MADWISVCCFQSNERPLALIKIFGNQNNSSESTDSEPISAENKKSTWQEGDETAVVVFRWSPTVGVPYG